MGKPLGQPAPQDMPSPVAPSPKGNDTVDERGRKVIPDIDVKNLRSQRQGEQMSVRAWVTNNSDQQIRIDTSYLLGQKRQHNRELRPNESRELQLYQGLVARNENEHQARIDYRLTANGDVFQNTYHIEYNLESDGARTVEELHDDGPVRDI